MRTFGAELSNDIREQMRNPHFANSLALLKAIRLNNHLVEATLMWRLPGATATPTGIERAEGIGGFLWETIKPESEQHKELLKNVRLSHREVASITFSRRNLFQGERIHLVISMYKKSSKKLFAKVSFSIDVKTGEVSGGDFTYPTVPSPKN